MSDLHFLPREIRDALAQERARAAGVRRGRLRVQVGETWYPIRSFDEDGFEVSVEAAPRLRGYVEIHDGARMVRSALIVGEAEADGVRRYGFKRVTAVRDTAPLDYVVAVDAPAGYLSAH